ncbi:MAG: amino acid ABC transporter ATP-binding protein, partial [Hyphomicrobiaceae bacterium]|nr:amino acid ABC transporter ATP-binding protein [Hyphomicrobiaceae bacterium]
MIDVVQLTKSFGELRVLDGIGFGVERAEVMVVLGPSGSGKSTLLRCISFLEPYDGGEIRVDGELVGYRINDRGQRVLRSEAENARHRQQVGMLFQSFNLFPHKTALENVMMGPLHARGQTKAEALEIARSLLAKVDLSEKADEYPIRLSGGQQQRVAIARALAMRPKVMLFDEVTS